MPQMNPCSFWHSLHIWIYRHLSSYIIYMILQYWNQNTKSMRVIIDISKNAIVLYPSLDFFCRSRYSLSPFVPD